MTCYHQCTGNCRRVGCNCACGEFHCDPNEKCIYEGEECPNHPTTPAEKWQVTTETPWSEAEQIARTTLLNELIEEVEIWIQMNARMSETQEGYTLSDVIKYLKSKLNK